MGACLSQVCTYNFHLLLEHCLVCLQLILQGLDNTQVYGNSQPRIMAVFFMSSQAGHLWEGKSGVKAGGNPILGADRICVGGQRSPFSKNYMKKFISSGTVLCN